MCAVKLLKVAFPYSDSITTNAVYQRSMSPNRGVATECYYGTMAEAPTATVKKLADHPRTTDDPMLWGSDTCNQILSK
jgi:hypothetical protein